MTQRLAVDIGGTFVDVIVYDDRTGQLMLHKNSTTPADPAAGVLRAVSEIHPDLSDVDAFVHGTTLGLNAILQRNGADVGVITNEGFRDIIEIARAAIPTAHMYNFSYAPPPPLVPRRHRAGVRGRLDAQGDEVTALDRTSVLAAGQYLVEVCGLTSIAICFLHSYANPEHERRTAEILRAAYPTVSVAVSSDLTREYREYERTSTVVMDAYIRPVLSDYIARLEEQLAEAHLTPPLHIMRSSGGAMTADVARSAPLTTVLSGPAGGVVGASFLARELALSRLLSFDVGGTSVDACVILDGEPTEVHEASIDTFPLLIPIFDIRTVGAGGGSIAWLDNGLLKVGPRSAGAVPGPVAYGQGGTEPTLTDAALVLGYLDADLFLGGQMSIDTDAARAAISETLADPLGIEGTAAAESVFRVLLARSVSALREITVERGLDPREFTLLSFGGAGGLLGAMLAREMGITTTIVPTVPAAFSAYGMLMSDLQHELATTVLQPLTANSLPQLTAHFDELMAQGAEVLERQGISQDSRRFVRSLDVRYRGQEHTLPVELGPDPSASEIIDAFHQLHRTRHGHAMDEPVEVLTLRVRALGMLGKPTLTRLPVGPAAETGPAAKRPAFDVATGEMCDFAVYHRHELLSGQEIAGPAVIEEGTSTTLFFSDQALTVDEYGHLLITRLDQP